MCGIAEIRCKNLALARADIGDLMKDFDFTEGLKAGVTTLIISGPRGNCFCAPNSQQKASFEMVLTQLLNSSESVVYSPNDYEEAESDYVRLEMPASEIGEDYWPSLHHRPMRIQVVKDLQES